MQSTAARKPAQKCGSIFSHGNARFAVKNSGKPRSFCWAALSLLKERNSALCDIIEQSLFFGVCGWMMNQTSEMIGKRYLLGAPIGEGGMGVVFRAFDRLTSETVALKQVRIPSTKLQFMSSTNSTDFRLALAQEFRLLSSLRHPNIISVLDYGFDHLRQPYFTMDLLENTQTILEAGRGKSPGEKLNLLMQMFHALAYLHRRRILHRDLKPDNVLVMGGQVKLLDFGLSVAREEFDYDTELEEISGTLAYMAPELLQGYPPTEVSDLYATGLMAYEMFAGAHPFTVGDVSKLVENIVHRVPDFDQLDVDPRIVIVLQRLLAKSPAERYQAANEVIRYYHEATGQENTLDTAVTRESFLQAAHFVGRQEEYGTLSQALSDARNGRGSTWLVGGESGVGKSRLLDELRTLALVNGVLVLRGQAVSDGGSPYQMWREALRWVALQADFANLEASVLKMLVPDIAHLIGRDVPDAPELDPQATRNRLLSVVESVFQRLTQPLALILEDIHWAGSESIAMLHRLNTVTRSVPLIVVASYRDDEFVDLPRSLPEMHLLKLERLDEISIAALSESMLGEAGRHPAVVDLLQRETEGNVFFMVEVVRTLAEEAGNFDDIGTVTLPHQVFAGGMQRVIRHRLTRVPQFARPLLEFAAIVGRRLDIDVLRLLGEGIDLDKWLLACENAAVIEVQDDRWRFAHDKLREELLAEIAPDRRQELHRLVALTIEQVYPHVPEKTAAMAHHWHEAGDVVKEAHYLALAGEHALNNGAYTETLGFLHPALRIAEEAGFSIVQRATVARQIGEAYYAIGDFYNSRYHLEQVLVLFGKRLPKSMPQLGVLLLGQVLRQLSYRLFHPKPDSSRRDEVRFTNLALAYERIAQVCVLVNDSFMSVYTALRMLNLTERGGASPELARAYVNVGFICGAIPNRVWADAYNRRAWETAQVVNNLPALAWVLEIRSMYGIGSCRWEESYQSLMRGREISEQIGDLRKRDECRGLVNVVLYHQGEFEEAFRLSRIHVDESMHRNDKYLPLLVMTEISLRLGQVGYKQLVVSNLEESQTMLNDNSGIEVFIWMSGLSALTYLHLEDKETAHKNAEWGLELAQQARPGLCYAFEGYAGTAETFMRLWESSTDPAEKRELQQKAYSACKALSGYGRVFLHARARSCLWRGLYAWRVGKHRQAVRLWQKGIAAAQRYAMPFDEALIYYEMGCSLPDGRPYLEKARTMFQSMNAAPDLARTQHLLDTL